MVAAGGQRFGGAPGAQPAARKSKALRNILIITAAIIVFAALGTGGWYFYSKHAAKVAAAKGNPAAQVSAPTAIQSAGAMDILLKVQQAMTNMTSCSANGTLTVFLDLSKITTADVNPKMSPNAQNANRHPRGMPMMITNITELSFKMARPSSYLFSADMRTKIDRQGMTNTMAYWSAGKSNFMFMDMHQRAVPPTYMQLPENDEAFETNSAKMQQFFGDSGLMGKLVKDLGQTADESVNGLDCYTLTAKVLGQKVEIWVNKSDYTIQQWQITLGGPMSDADIDDAFAAFASNTNMTQMQLAQMDSAKAQFKQMAPIITKVRGVITFTSSEMQLNQTYAADDFNYPVPPGVRLMQLPVFNAAGNGSALANRQRNTCINNLRQIDAAKNQWALEHGATTGTAVTEDDIKPYLAGGRMPVCPSGGTYTIGKVGENPTCSIPGHVLP